DPAAVRVQPGGPHAEQLGGPVRARREPMGGVVVVVEEEGLRQGGAAVRRVRLVADDGQLAVEAGVPEGVGRREPGDAVADHDDAPQGGGAHASLSAATGQTRTAACAAAASASPTCS